MTATRRIGAEDSATRTALLDAALRLMVDEGYAAVTSRRVAAEAGLKPQLVHYYFRTMDDLFLALVRRGAEQSLERLAQALASPQPLQALWEFSSDPAGATLQIEIAALANHRKAVQAEALAFAEQFRRLQLDALTDAFAQSGIEPEAAVVAIDGLARFLVMEAQLGLTIGHAQVRALVERQLDQLEGDSEDAGASSGDVLASGDRASRSPH